jgi:hypothetical protein
MKATGKQGLESKCPAHMDGIVGAMWDLHWYTLECFQWASGCGVIWVIFSFK